jgi:23S rRNA (pseudouridine1915-N3)-methyltransferase
MINIIAIGTKMPKWIDDGINHYLKQMPNTKIISIKNSNKNQENAELIKKIDNKSYIIALDEKGKNLSSLEFAGKIGDLQEQYNNIVFLIGGADGLTLGLKNKVHLILSLSRATMPHSLARLVLVEQLYRAKTIINNHPYHRE